MNRDAALYRLRFQCERRAIIELLAAADGNVSEAARLAGVNRRTFDRLMRRHQIELTPSRRIPIERDGAPLGGLA